ncbi:hypothetical protein LSTR_LSTR011440 [Laodelphax striatellus]|uniref:[histone H3]-dimethyl-L-lysine(36) demethylase n=1 Tax=Laodelphax striatellus TaxID=195883 RepID=A0A482WH19_LAOST|nr:hypothetical protein LSTR_LSTR011440 [Laodelphax striatellus]
MESKEKKAYCFCGVVDDEDPRFMIQCDACKDWFHGSCVNVFEYVSHDYEKYHCPKCEPVHGQSIMKREYNWHRHDFFDMNAEGKPIETGTPEFIKELKNRPFYSSDAVVLKMKGDDLTMQYLLEHGFEQPILVEKNEGLGLTVPPSTITLRDLEAAIGSNYPIDVIDVYRQSDLKMKFGEFVNYFLGERRHRVLNLLSLEITETRLSQFVEPPAIARSLDWATTIWPKDYDLEDKEYCMDKPTVQKYCLIGARDSYTDFHIDFGGTSVWYHVIQGEKIFYLIKPTPSNVALYQRWMTSSTQYETFFADQVDSCYECTIRAGNTLFIPTGWIHAVLTPQDTLVFGGNFVHSLSIPMQLQIYEMEKKMETPEKFRFPGFETVNWFAAREICKELKMINKNATQVPQYLLIGVKALLVALKQWHQDKNANKNKREHIPMLVEAPVLLKELSKEIRNAERFLNTLNPPKPERESKRKRRKPLNKDFVDYSQQRLNVMEEEAQPEVKEPIRLTLQAKPEVKETTKLHLQVKSEVKEPLKLSIKVLNKKFELSQEENQMQDVQVMNTPHLRPPLKLTLPKPATYPYSTSLEPPRLSIEPNKNWSVKPEPNDFVVDNQGDLKMKIEKRPLRSLDSGMNEKRSGTNNSVYDFHDDSDENEDEDCLTIDENPARSSIFRGNSTSTRIPTSFRSKKFQFQLGSVLASVNSHENPDVDVLSDSPKNGIEELLKASCYPSAEEMGRTSPSTTEAIAGMMAIASQGPSFLVEAMEADRLRLKRKARSATVTQQDDLDETIRKVHQDDDFIYPSLDLSDEDELPRTGKGDEAWNPRAKVGAIAPKRDRPSREGTRKQSVEKGLEAAAAARHATPRSRNPPRKKKPAKRTRQPAAATAATAAAASAPQPSTSTASAATDPPHSRNATDKGKKPKKGMATAKQRLGKILKLHKMMH